MPKSYRDPVWDQIEKKVAADVGIPVSLLRDIRTKGERSNSDQVSEAGARTVYQVIPSTRDAIRKKHGVDAYANPESAARAAALLLKESLARNKGDQAAAAGEYHGGPNRRNWGKRTRAYIERVTGAKGGDRASGGGSTFDRVKAQREARENAGPSISKVYEAYKSGLMDPQDAAQFENDVNEGRVMLPRGAGLKKTPAAPVLPAGVIKAYNSHEMDPEDRAQVDQDVREGLVSLPRGVKLQAPAPRTTGELLGMGTRNVMEGAGSLVDFVAGPVNALVNALPGKQGLSTTPFRDLAASGADAMGLAQPESAQERMNAAIIEGGTGGLASAGAGAALAPVRGATGAAGRALASAPVTDIASGAAAGGSSELARQSGAGPVGQLAAGLLGGGAAVGGALGAQRTVNRALLRRAKTADEVVAAAPREEIFDRAGNLTEEGREIVIQRDIAPDDLRAAYDEAPPGVRAATANDQAPEAGARAVAVGDDVPPPRVEEPAPTEPAATPRAPAEPPLPTGAAARLAEAKSEGVPLTRGQATQDFEAQDAEQTLLADAGRPGAEARTFAAEQAVKIKEAAARFESAFGDRTLNATDRGQIVKDAIRELKEEGRKGVQALYKAAAETPGHDIPIPRDAILDEADRLILDTPMEQGSKDALERALAKFGLLGDKIETNGRYRSVVTDDGRKITIRGEVEPLTLNNAETFRQALNQAWDQKGLMGGAIRALDNAVDDILEKTATSERNDLFKEARQASRQQKQTFEAKDVVQSLADWKKGTRTDVVLPEKAIASIFSGGKEGLTNLKKIKALLLSKPTEQTRAAWKAIQAQGVGDILGQAYTTNSNLGGGGIGSISGAKLNSAIEKFGTDKLKVLLDESEFNHLMKLRRIFGYATIPIKNTTNPSGSGFKVMKFLAPFASKMSPLMPYGMAARELIDKGREIAKSQQTLKGITEFSEEAAAKGKTASSVDAADRAANEFIRKFIETAGSGRLLAPILASGSSDEGEQ